MKEDQKYQLMYDHLEDSVLAPRQCLYCADTECDGTNCQSTFDHQDFHDASTFFTATINPLVINAKLDRPLDSHAPQTATNYAYEGDDWGEHDESYEQELYSQEYEHDLWDTEDANQDEEYHEEYTAEHEEVEHEDDQGASPDSEDQDEDDQGNYD